MLASDQVAGPCTMLLRKPDSWKGVIPCTVMLLTPMLVVVAEGWHRRVFSDHHSSWVAQVHRLVLFSSGGNRECIGLAGIVGGVIGL